MPPAAAPAISVVVPLYNKEATVARCLKSILGQTFRDFEVIVVDDGSTDSGARVASGFDDPRIRVVCQENRGVSAARNRGIAEAAAPLIAFLDADDTWEPAFLQAIDRLARDYPSAGIFATGKRICLEGRGFVESYARLPEGASTGLLRNYPEALREGTLVSPSNVALRRSVIEHVGGFPEGVAIGEDRDLWVRITLYYPIGYDQRILATYYVSQGNVCCRAAWRPPYPSAISTLRRLITSGSLDRAQFEQARRLADWLVLDHLYNLVEAHDRPELKKRIREESFSTLRFRAEARLLGLAARFVPLRVIALLKHKEKWLPTLIDRRKTYVGRVLVHRRMLAR